MNGKKRQLGLGVLGWIIATPFILLGLLIVLAIGYLIYCEANKAYWDNKVKKMCEKYGGATIYETVVLTREEYDRNDGEKGTIQVMPEGTSLDKHEYAYKIIVAVKNKYNPRVRRSEYKIYRKYDGKVLGKWVTYSRVGGGFPLSQSHESVFSCKDIPGFHSDIIRQIFFMSGEWQ